MTEIVWAAALIFAQFGGAPAPQGAAADSVKLEQMARVALSHVERMRGQKLSKPLKMGVKNKAQITTFIQGRLKEEYGDKKVAAEGRLLKLQGLLPPELDYGAFITRMLAEQVAGFYDHTRQELHIAAWLPVMLQEPVMAHEIFHAIQDQEWGGGALIDSKKYTHDQVLAHAALLEGDATIVMLDYTQVKAGLESDIAKSGAAINLVAMSLPMQMASPEFPVMASAPDYLKQSLIFPYQQGLLFIAGLRQGGMSQADLRKVYADPPQSSEQILHPKKYYAQRDVPSGVQFGQLVDGYERVWDGTTGEFHARQLLLRHLSVPRSTVGAAGWDGDFTVVEQKGKAAYAATASTWDSPAEATEFEAALNALYAARPAPKVGPKAALSVSRRGADLFYVFASTQALADTALARLKAKAKFDRK